MILPPLLLSSPTQYFLAWIFLFLLLTSLVKEIPLSGSIHSAPKRGITKTTTSRNGSDFKPNTQELLSSSHAILAPKPSKMPNHLLIQHINNKIVSCQDGSRSFWSMAKVVSQNSCQSSLPPLKNNSDASSTTLLGQSFSISLCLQLQPGRPRGPTTSLPPFKFTISPIKFSTRKVRETLLQLDTSKSKGPDGIPAIVLKT